MHTTDDEDDSQHEISHELCEVLEAVISSFVQAHNNDLSSLTILSGVEMTASIWRKVALSAGAYPEEVRKCITDAETCSEPHFSDRMAGVVRAVAEVEVEDIKSGDMN